MTFLERFIRRPQQVWLRRLLFQVHLWLGLIAALYVIAIGVTGSILVFKTEAVASLLPRMREPTGNTGRLAPVGAVIRNAKAHNPQDRVVLVHLPRGDRKEYEVVALRGVGMRSSKIMLTAHPETGEIIGGVNLTRSWIGWAHNIHIFLLAGRGGFIANGVGAVVVLLLAATGLVLWWPGINNWRRAFKIDFGLRWRRIVFDSHNVIGFYTLGLLVIWSVSTVYFVWPEKVVTVVNAFSRVSEFEAPVVKPPADGASARFDPDSAIRAARALVPNAQVISVMLPARGPSSPLVVHMAPPGAQVGSSDAPHNATEIYFDPYTGKQLAIRAPEQGGTLGARVLRLMEPLHFGNRWGLAVKVLWAVLGLSLPALAVTGAIMYWNRSLRRHLKRKERPAAPPQHQGLRRTQNDAAGKEKQAEEEADLHHRVR